jgi:hypothetical protein
VIVPNEKRRSRRKSGRSPLRKPRQITEFPDEGNIAFEWHEFRCETCREEYSAFVTKRELANPFVRLCVCCEAIALKVVKKASIDSYDS